MYDQGTRPHYCIVFNLCWNYELKLHLLTVNIESKLTCGGYRTNLLLRFFYTNVSFVSEFAKWHLAHLHLCAIKGACGIAPPLIPAFPKIMENASCKTDLTGNLISFVKDQTI